MRECGFSYEEAMDLPVAAREWWIAEEEKDRRAENQGSKGDGHVDPFGRVHGRSSKK